MTVRCSTCRNEVDVKYAWREVKGWTQPRSGGGDHGITLREETGRYRCPACMAQARYGGSEHALSLDL